MKNSWNQLHEVYPNEGTTEELPMNIHFSDGALRRLQQLAQSEQPKLQLMYDNEDCGCAVNGVPLLAIVKHVDEQYVAAQVATELLSVYYFPQHAIYFENEMQIDFNPATNALKLSSAQQIYTHDLHVKNIG
jgi:uncharacterized protein YqkB